MLRYMLHGKPREMGLGPLDAVGLAEARELARTARRRIRVEGIDPIAARKAATAQSKVDSASAKLSSRPPLKGTSPRMRRAGKTPSIASSGGRPSQPMHIQQ